MDDRVLAPVTLQVPVIEGWLKRRGRRRVRAVMRGYRRLKAAGRLDRIAEVREAIARTRLTRVGGYASALLFGAGTANAELVVRQYLLSHVAHLTLNRTLLRSLGRSGSPVVHPLPPEWRAVVRQHGFKVARIRSAVVWNGYVALMFAYGVTSVGKRVLKSLIALLRPSAGRCGRYVFFDGLSEGNLPRPCADGRSHDIVTWYQQWPGRIGGLDALCHGVSGVADSEADRIPVLRLSSAVPALSSLAGLMRFISWGVTATGFAAVDALRGRWWHALLLSQASAASVVRIGPPDRMARDYVFHLSNRIFRPLWTYEAERMGSRITFCFYATNIETFKRPQGYPVQANYWHAMSWPLYLVWDEFQADFVRRAVGSGARIDVVGPIWFSSSAEEVPETPEGAVAVFDIQPIRASAYQERAETLEYYTPKTVNRFLLDICAATRNCGGVMVLKRKRHIGRRLHPRYGAFVERLAKSEGFLAVDPSVVAMRVIERCQVVVSLPFTSTALLGREAGKPSIYYDPHGLVEHDDRAAHGIPIVTGADELNAWMADHLGRSTSA